MTIEFTARTTGGEIREPREEMFIMIRVEVDAPVVEIQNDGQVQQAQTNHRTEHSGGVGRCTIANSKQSSNNG